MFKRKKSKILVFVILGSTYLLIQSESGYNSLEGTAILVLSKNIELEKSVKPVLFHICRSNIIRDTLVFVKIDFVQIVFKG